jgi:hypothetical protein
MNRFDRTRTIIRLIIWSTLTLWSAHGWAQATETTEETSDNDDTPTTQTENTPPQAPRPRYPSNTRQQMEMLASQLDNKETTQWINNGEDTFLAIWNADRTGDAKGAILIIHAEGEHPAWPQTTRPLHDTLPDYGWATMAVHLPNPYHTPIPQRTLATRSTVNNNGDTATETEVKAEAELSTAPPQDITLNTTPSTTSNTIDIEATSSDRLAAALQFLHDKGQFNIILMGSGIGAIRTHHFIKSITPIVTDKNLREKLEKPIQASIIFNARNQLPKDNNAFDEWFFDPEIPVLDIYTASDVRNKKEAAYRKILGKRKRAIKHDQIKIVSINHETSWQENILSRRIRSFLEANLKGIEVNKNKKNN